MFGIGTSVRPLGGLSAVQARQFASVLRTVPDEMAHYKGLLAFRQLATEALETLAAPGAPEAAAQTDPSR